MKKQIKNLLCKIPGFYSFYQGIRYRDAGIIRKWVTHNNSFVSKKHLHPFVFYGDQAYVRLYKHAEFIYTPEQLGGLANLEYKSIEYEKCELALLLKYIKDGATFLDIGANFGFYSVIIGLERSDVCIHSFEPIPITFNVLQQNIEHNKLDDIVYANQECVANKECKLIMTTDRCAANHITLDNFIDENTTKVSCTTVDDYVSKHKIMQVDFIKCDVEGAELQVMKGAKNTLSSCKPDILLEICDCHTKRLGYQGKEIISFLAQLGYSCQLVTKDINKPLKTINSIDNINSVSNFFFTMRDNLTQ